jgi:hypothetical protein
MLIGGNGCDQADVYFNHNTIITTGSATRSHFFEVEIPSGTLMPRYGFHNNIYSANSTSHIADNCTVNSVDQDCVSDENAYNNIIFDNGAGTVSCAAYYGPNAALCTTSGIAAVGFVDAGAGNYRCDVGGACDDAALDGEDIGITEDGYTLMACLTEVAETGVNQDCSGGDGSGGVGEAQLGSGRRAFGSRK